MDIIYVPTPAHPHLIKPPSIPHSVVNLTLPDGTVRGGQVLEIQGDKAIVQVSCLIVIIYSQEPLHSLRLLKGMEGWSHIDIRMAMVALPG